MCINEAKTVYKCFEVIKSCETCRHLECDDVIPIEICNSGTCKKTKEKVLLNNDCIAWDFDEELFDDTFWLIRRDMGVRI